MNVDVSLGMNQHRRAGSEDRSQAPCWLQGFASYCSRSVQNASSPTHAGFLASFLLKGTTSSVGCLGDWSIRSEHHSMAVPRKPLALERECRILGIE
jgi:hypothetical protein